MQKKWSEPDLITLSVTNTYDISDGYKGKVRCSTCNKVFEGGHQFNNHLKSSPIGIGAGNECPAGNRTDNIIQESAVLIS